MSHRGYWHDHAPSVGNRPDQDPGTEQTDNGRGSGRGIQWSRQQAVYAGGNQYLGSLAMGHHQAACRKVETRIRKVYWQAMRTNFQKDYKCSGHHRTCRFPGPSMIRDQTDLIACMHSGAHFTLSHIFLHVIQHFPLLRKVAHKQTSTRKGKKTMTC